MDIKDVNINNVKNLTEKDRRSLHRQAVAGFASFVLLKLVLHSFFGALAKTLRRRADMKK